MSNIHYELPLPSSAGHFRFYPGSHRDCVLECRWNDPPNPELNFVFKRVLFYSCTQQEATAVNLIRLAYDKLVELDISSFFAEMDAKKVERINSDRYWPDPRPYRRFIIYVDDGPLYEVICQEVEIKYFSNNGEGPSNQS